MSENKQQSKFMDYLQMLYDARIAGFPKLALMGALVVPDICSHICLRYDCVGNNKLDKNPYHTCNRHDVDMDKYPLIRQTKKGYKPNGANLYKYWCMQYIKLPCELSSYEVNFDHSLFSKSKETLTQKENDLIKEYEKIQFQTYEASLEQLANILYDMRCRLFHAMNCTTSGKWYLTFQHSSDAVSFHMGRGYVRINDEKCYHSDIPRKTYDAAELIDAICDAGRRFYGCLLDADKKFLDTFDDDVLIDNLYLVTNAQKYGKRNED